MAELIELNLVWPFNLDGTLNAPEVVYRLIGELRRRERAGDTMKQICHWLALHGIPMINKALWAVIENRQMLPTREGRAWSERDWPELLEAWPLRGDGTLIAPREIYVLVAELRMRIDRGDKLGRTRRWLTRQHDIWMDGSGLWKVITDERLIPV